MFHRYLRAETPFNTSLDVLNSFVFLSQWKAIKFEAAHIMTNYSVHTLYVLLLRSIWPAKKHGQPGAWLQTDRNILGSLNWWTQSHCTKLTSWGQGVIFGEWLVVLGGWAPFWDQSQVSPRLGCPRPSQQLHPLANLNLYVHFNYVTIVYILCSILPVLAPVFIDDLLLHSNLHITQLMPSFIFLITLLLSVILRQLLGFLLTEFHGCFGSWSSPPVILSWQWQFSAQGGDSGKNQQLGKKVAAW